MDDNNVSSTSSKKKKAVKNPSSSPKKKKARNIAKATDEVAADLSLYDSTKGRVRKGTTFYEPTTK